MEVVSNAYIDISTLNEPRSLDSEVAVATWLLEHEGLILSREMPENCELNCHVEVPISTLRRKLHGWFRPDFECLER